MIQMIIKQFHELQVQATVMQKGWEVFRYYQILKS